MSLSIMATKIKAVVKVLKKKYTNLTAEEAIDLAIEILQAVDRADSGVEDREQGG